MIKKLLIGLPLLLFAIAVAPFSAQAHVYGDECEPPHDACRDACNITQLSHNAFVSCLDACEPSFMQCERATPFTDCSHQRFHCSKPCNYLLSFHVSQFDSCIAFCDAQQDSCKVSQSKPADSVSTPADPESANPVLPEPAEPDQTITPEKEQQPKDAEIIGKPYITTMEYGIDIREGDTVKAGKKETVTIIYPDGSKIVMKPGSSMNVKSWIELIRGKFEFWVKKTRKKFEIRTPTAIQAIRGTEFTVDASSLKTVVRVYDSIVDVSDKNGKNTVEVKAGYQVTVTKKKVGKVTKIPAYLVKRWKAQNAQ